MSTVEAGGLQGDKVSAIQKKHMVETDTSERKRHSRLSARIATHLLHMYFHFFTYAATESTASKF